MSPHSTSSNRIVHFRLVGFLDPSSFSGRQGYGTQLENVINTLIMFLISSSSKFAALLVLLETSGGQPPSVHSAALEMFCDSKLVNRFLECPLTIEYVKGLFLPRSSYLLHTAPVQNLSKSGFFSPVCSCRHLTSHNLCTVCRHIP